MFFFKAQAGAGGRLRIPMDWLREFRWWTAYLLLACAGSLHAQTEALQVKRLADLREGPGASARSLAVLPAQTPVTRLPARQGAWMQVKTEAGQTGWVHMFDVGTTATQSPVGSATSGALRGITSFFNRGSAQPGTTTATSTIGIRGLGAEDIANAQPNLTALAQAEATRVDAAQARRFATEAPLVARSIDLLQEPPAPANNAVAPKTTNFGQ
jgi:hypothetical protein